MKHYRICIFGAGVIGLSTAYELLSQRPDLSGKILIIDQLRSGQSSWAGAGLLPPPPTKASSDPMEQLQRLSLSQFEKWSNDLKQLTGIDNGFRRCGGYYLAFSSGEFASLIGLADFWEEVGIEFEKKTLDQLAIEERWVAKQLQDRAPKLIAKIPGETQVRNPWHLQALRAACEKLGATILSTSDFESSFPTLSPEEMSVTVSGEKHTFDQAVVACGSWTSEFLSNCFEGYQGIQIFPVKGQIVLLNSGTVRFRSILNVGTRYLVPREDGRILIGSTEEEVGFDDSVSEEIRDELLQFAAEVLPGIVDFPIEKQWSGFRPASYYHAPVIGPLKENSNVWVAAGHFRSGIQYSVGTAKCVAAGLLGSEMPIDLGVFSPNLSTSRSGSTHVG